MKWFTSDLHFGHANIINYCNRPWPDVSAMKDALIAKWNAVVKPDDTVYVLGDFAMCIRTPEVRAITKQLNGFKILIKGNHDPRSGWGAFDAVLDEAVIYIGGQRVRMSHFPYRQTLWESVFKRFDDRYSHLRPTPSADEWLLHGHVHQVWKIRRDRRMINVGVDVWKYAPISVDVIQSILSGRYE